MTEVLVLGLLLAYLRVCGFGRRNVVGAHQYRGRVLGPGPLRGVRTGQQIQGLRSQRPSGIGEVRVDGLLLALRRRTESRRWDDLLQDVFGLGLLNDLLDRRRQLRLLTPESAGRSRRGQRGRVGAEPDVQL